MGLDVTAHKNIKFLSMENPSEEQWDEGAFQAFVITPEWNNRISTLKINGYYKPGESERFIGYSYSSHSFLRSLICENILNINPKAWHEEVLEPGSDFEEWLNFADNEGVIDGKTSKKLRNDFRKWQTIAEEKLSEWYCQHYVDWMKTFEFASENGAVEYH